MLDQGDITDGLITFRNSQAAEGRGTIMHISRQAVVFEVYNPYSIVQLSEVLNQVRILRQHRPVYDGRAVVSNLLATGVMAIVHATLVDPWLTSEKPGEGLRQEARAFVDEWQATTRQLIPEYRLAVGNFRNFLEDLARWIGHGELTSGINEPTAGDALKREFLGDVEAGVAEQLGALMQVFESRAAQVPPEQAQAHKAFCRRELHPLVLIAPFLHRTYTKPLGYAGDYEMVNMILRDPMEGRNTYARLLNSLNLRTGAAAAHRNRIEILISTLHERAALAQRDGRRLQVLNIACGPAGEIQRFIREDPLASSCDLTLLDFNAETLQWTKSRIDSAMADSGRSPVVSYIHKSIHDLLKEASGRRDDGAAKPQYDLVYCAGLFDYLSDKVCQRLLRLFAEWTRPGGTVLATNVHARNPNRFYMEHLLEWYLVYRDEAGMRALAPHGCGSTVWCDATGVNVMLALDVPGTR